MAPGRRSSLLAAALAFGCMMTGAAQSQGSALATIEATPREGGVTLVGRIVALSPGQYDAQMTIDKSGPSGTTRTTQGGALTMQAGGQEIVATIGLSMDAGDRLVVDLVVTQANRPVATSSLKVGD